MRRIKDVISCIKRVRLEHQFKNRLSLGYDTNIQKTNISLSGSGKLIIENDCQVRDGVLFSVSDDGDLRVGQATFFNRNTIIACHNEIDIGEQTIFGSNVCVYDHDHVFSTEGVDKHNFKCASVSIGKNCWIGSNVVILKGTHLGDGCVVGAGCVVRGTYPNNSLIKSNRELVVEPIVKK